MGGRGRPTEGWSRYSSTPLASTATLATCARGIRGSGAKSAEVLAPLLLSTCVHVASLALEAKGTPCTPNLPRDDYTLASKSRVHSFIARAPGPAGAVGADFSLETGASLNSRTVQRASGMEYLVACRGGCLRRARPAFLAGT